MNPLPHELSDFDNKFPIIDSIWLREELDMLRSDGLSRQGFTDARTHAQVRKHVSMLTVNESVRLVFVALYSPNKQPLIKKIISGPTLSKIPALDFNGYVNKWIHIDCPYGKDLILKIMSLCPNVTVRDMVDLSKKLSFPLELKNIRQILKLKTHQRLRLNDRMNQDQYLRVMRNLVS